MRKVFCCITPNSTSENLGGPWPPSLLLSLCFTILLSHLLVLHSKCSSSIICSPLLLLHSKCSSILCSPLLFYAFLHSKCSSTLSCTLSAPLLCSPLLLLHSKCSPSIPCFPLLLLHSKCFFLLIYALLLLFYSMLFFSSFLSALFLLFKCSCSILCSLLLLLSKCSSMLSSFLCFSSNLYCTFPLCLSAATRQELNQGLYHWFSDRDPGIVSDNAITPPSPLGIW